MTSSGRGIRRRLALRGRPQSRGARLGPVLQWAAVFAAVGVTVLLARPAGGQQPGDGGPRLGPLLYQRSCASCHGNYGEGTFRGPSLISVGAASADYWLRSGRMPLREPDQRPQRGEPAFDDAEIRQLVDYVTRLGAGPAIPDVDLASVDLARGGDLYRVNCASCHNWDGKGGALVGLANAAPLHSVPNLQVAEAIRIGPGTMPEFTQAQLSDMDLNDVVAYVDYLRTPQDVGGYGLAHWGPSTETVAGFVAIGLLVLMTAWLGESRGG
jgi:ubiquinol-cytochrome c reductase cytochrome c subunit